MKKFFIVYFILLVTACALGSAPQPGWVTTADVIEVYDGDTVVVEVKKIFRVRLLDCWAPEIKTRDDVEKKRGFASRDHLRKLIDDRQVILEIPASENGEIGKSISMSRVLGRIYMQDGRSVSEVMVKAGHATKEKQ